TSTNSNESRVYTRRRLMNAMEKINSFLDAFLLTKNINELFEFAVVGKAREGGVFAVDV
ncbi:hypothetical protein A2U01_0088880, partial [Trifolium medium]|nr:hypothetical protein [Trifolium medium]